MDRLAVMKTFIRVVEAGSFCAAARHLNIGQPAVSKCVAHLEERLGTCLLMRSTRCVRPTQAGQRYYTHARLAIEAAEGADLAARGVGADLTGRLRVSADVTFACLHVVPRLPVFLAALPNVSIELVLDDRPIDLIEEGIDLALRVGPLRDSSLTARKIASCRRLVLGAPSYFDAAGIPMTPSELIDHTSVIFTQNHDLWTFRKGSSETSVRVPSRVRVSANEGVRAAVVNGMGIAVASEWMFAPELASGAVRTILRDWSLPVCDLWAVSPTGRMASAKARAFVHFVNVELQSARWSWSRRVPEEGDEYEAVPSAVINAAA